MKKTIAILLALVLQFLYPLNKERVENNAKILAEKQAQKAAEKEVQE